MGLVVWVCHVCACGCVCAGIDYKQRSLEINGKQLRLSIWYVFVCSCLCVQRESGLLDMGMYQRVCASYVCVSYSIGLHFWNKTKSFKFSWFRRHP